MYAGMLFIESCEKPLLDYCKKGMEFLFNETKLSLPLDWRETVIFERLFIIMTNRSLGIEAYLYYAADD